MTVRYISPTGSDSTGDGSIGSPWATMQKWVTTAPAAGDTLYLRGGTYTNSPCTYVGKNDPGSDPDLYPLWGTAGSPITICNYPGETPVFTGTNGGAGILAIWRASYLIIDGLQVYNFTIGSTGYIYTGYTGYADEVVHLAEHVTIRNCRFTMLTGNGTNQGHPLYVTADSDYVTIEDCVLIGPGNRTYGDGGYACQFYEGGRPDPPIHNLFQRNVVVGWNQGGVTLWGAPTGSILHNTFINNSTHVRLVTFDAATVRDNAGDTAWGGVGQDINSDSSGTLTADHNYWGQTFNADYSPVTGNTAIGGAADGTDAGARPFIQSRGVAVI